MNTPAPRRSAPQTRPLRSNAVSTTVSPAQRHRQRGVTWSAHPLPRTRNPQSAQEPPGGAVAVGAPVYLLASAQRPQTHGIPACGREPGHWHFDVRFLVQAEHDRFRVSDESHALAWVPAVGLNSLTNEESVLRMARKWVVRRGNGDRWIEPE